MDSTHGFMPPNSTAPQVNTKVPQAANEETAWFGFTQLCSNNQGPFSQNAHSQPVELSCEAGGEGSSDWSPIEGLIPLSVVSFSPCITTTNSWTICCHPPCTLNCCLAGCCYQRAPH